MVNKNKADSYINVMETLVAEEVDRHLKRLPERTVRYIKRSEVETFALNRLPALYASCEKGFHYQRARGQQDLKSQITDAVRQAFAAVQVDPIRFSQPLQLGKDSEQAEAVLQLLKDCLKTPDLTWETAVGKLQRLRKRNQKASPTSPTSSSSQESLSPRQVTPQSSVSSQSIQRPGTYIGRTSWKPRRQRTEPSGGFEDTYLR